MSTIVQSPFQPVEERGWRRGLGNLLEGEWSSWFKTSRWLKHLIMWIIIINGMMGIMVYATVEAAADGTEGPPMLFMYGIFGGMFVAFGVMVIMQRVIIGEKSSGTAAWVLSKPVTRTAFVFSRLVVNTMAILLTAVVVPGILVYITIGSLTELGWLSPLGVLAGLAVVALHMFFWITLVLMLGTMFESSTGVIAVPIGLYFALWLFSGNIPGLIYISPLVLVFSPDSEKLGDIATSLMTGSAVFSWIPVAMTVVLCITFIALSIWRFNRQEF